MIKKLYVGLSHHVGQMIVCSLLGVFGLEENGKTMGTTPINW